MEQTFSIAGGSGSGTINLTFSADGSPYALNYIETLTGAIDSILARGGNTDPIGPIVGAGAGNAFLPGALAPDATPIYQLMPGTVQTGPRTYDITTQGYAIDSVPGGVILNGDSAGGDSILVVGGGASPPTTVNTFGSDNLVIFIDGDNVFTGASQGGNETIVGGAGHDTITTGTGNTTVNAGTGTDVIYLNDTGTGGLNDAVYLDSGYSLVLSNGTHDFVVVTSGQQTIVGGAAANPSDNLTVALLPNLDSTPAGNNLVNGGSGGLTVFDDSSANTINGGSGSLFFIGGHNIAATIDPGSGSATIFATEGDDITLGALPGAPGHTSLLAGNGNETLNGGAAQSNLLIFGANQNNSGNAVDFLVGGSGNDTLVAGAGSETLAGGAGNNVFLIDLLASQNATLTIADFTGGDSVAFGHYSASDVAAALQSGTETNAGFVVTFAESNTTVTFAGVTSEAQISGHTITFF